MVKSYPLQSTFLNALNLNQQGTAEQRNNSWHTLSKRIFVVKKRLDVFSK